MCRNDKKLLRYELRLDLYEAVDAEGSYLEESSVGRVFVNLAKIEEPSRWKRLLADNSVKPQNMGVWWELWEKHQKDLEKHAPDEDDDDEDDDEDSVIVSKSNGVTEDGDDELADGQSATKKKKKVKKNKKKESNQRAFLSCLQDDCLLNLRSFYVF